MYHKRGFHKGCHSHAYYKNYGEHPLKKAWKERQQSNFNTPPANVKELNDSYELYIVAPGYEKEDFKTSTAGQILTIKVDKKPASEENWKRREYNPKGFIRQFELNEKIDTMAITGTYRNGILILTLPKLEGFETASQKIEID